VNNKTPYQIWPRWFWITGILMPACGGTLINVHYHWGIFMPTFTIQKFQNLHMWNIYTFDLIICAPPCWTSFVHTKSMLLNGDLFEFWISIDWNFRAQPTIETKCVWSCKKTSIWSKYVKTCSCNILNYILIESINLIVYTQLLQIKYHKT
jgi:hypothetical protein